MTREVLVATVIEEVVAVTLKVVEVLSVVVAVAVAVGVV